MILIFFIFINFKLSFMIMIFRAVAETQTKNSIHFVILLGKLDRKYQYENDVIASIKISMSKKEYRYLRKVWWLYEKRIGETLKLEVFFLIKGEFFIAKFRVKSSNRKPQMIYFPLFCFRNLTIKQRTAKIWKLNLLVNEKFWSSVNES